MCFHVISFKAALGKKFIPKYFTSAGELEETVVPLKTLTYLRKLNNFMEVGSPLV